MDEKNQIRQCAAMLTGIAVGVSLSLVGCGNESGTGQASAQIDTLPSGRVVVTNGANGVWDSESAWRVEEEWRIGRVEGEGPDLFGDIAAIAVDALDRTYVLERQDQEIRVFDRDGHYVRTFGRKGKGPGEFQDAVGLSVAPDGKLWVVDPQFGRVSVFDSTGRFARSYRTPGGFSVMPWPGGFDRRGDFYDIARDPRDEPGWSRSVLVRYDTAFVPLDTLRPPRFDNPDAVAELVTADGRGRTQVRLPYTSSSLWALTPAGDFWAVHTGRYELDRISASGDTLTTATRPFTPVPVTSEERSDALKRLEWFTKQGGRIDPDRIPKVKPAVSALYVADDGSLWVRRVVQTVVPGESLFDVFSPDARLLGQVHLPFQPSMSPVIRNDVIVAMIRGEMGVPFVVRARIVKP